jgi:hypothetical protein
MYLILINNSFEEIEYQCLLVIVLKFGPARRVNLGLKQDRVEEKTGKKKPGVIR